MDRGLLMAYILTQDKKGYDDDKMLGFFFLQFVKVF